MGEELKKLLEEYSDLVKDISEEDIKEFIRLIKEGKSSFVQSMIGKLSDEEFLKIKGDNVKYFEAKARIAKRSEEFSSKLYELAKKKAIELLFTV